MSNLFEESFNFSPSAAHMHSDQLRRIKKKKFLRAHRAYSKLIIIILFIHHRYLFFLSPTDLRVKQLHDVLQMSSVRLAGSFPRSNTS